MDHQYSSVLGLGSETESLGLAGQPVLPNGQTQGSVRNPVPPNKAGSD